MVQQISILACTGASFAIKGIQLQRIGFKMYFSLFFSEAANCPPGGESRAANRFRYIYLDLLHLYSKDIFIVYLGKGKIACIVVCFMTRKTVSDTI